MKKPILAVISCLCLGCAETIVTERITAPDGTITERSTKSKGVDADAFAAGAGAVSAIAAAKVHSEK